MKNRYQAISWAPKAVEAKRLKPGDVYIDYNYYSWRQRDTSPPHALIIGCSIDSINVIVTVLVNGNIKRRQLKLLQLIARIMELPPASQRLRCP